MTYPSHLQGLDQNTEAEVVGEGKGVRTPRVYASCGKERILASAMEFEEHFYSKS